jgi:hypothetical protein
VPDFQLMDNHRRHFAVFARFIDQPLQSLARDRYVFDGKPDEDDDCSLEIRFSNDGVITLGVASDGQSVQANSDPLTIQESFTLDCGSRCEWQRVELTASTPWSRLRGRRLSRVEAMVETWTSGNQTMRYVAGWVLWFGGDFVSYCNFGDNGQVLFNEKAPAIDDVPAIYEQVAPHVA